MTVTDKPIIADLDCARHLEQRVKALSYDERSSMPRERPVLIEELSRDAEVLRRMLSDTNFRINALVAVCRLPPEILAEVFFILADIEPPQIDDTIRTLGWVRLAHVCKIWRDICLSRPALWANSIGTLPRALLTFLERAGDHVALHYQLSEGWAKGWSNISAIAPRLRELKSRSSRIHTLIWGASTQQEAWSIASTLISGTFDALRELHLTSGSASWNIESTSTLSLNSISLRVLRLDSFFIRFSTPRLTSLALRGIDCNALEIMQIALCCPLLTSLHLESLNNLRIAEEADFLPTIQLAHLRTLLLDLRVFGEDMDIFIQHIEIPNTTVIHIRNVRLEEIIDYSLFTRLFMVTCVRGEETSLHFNIGSMSLSARRMETLPWLVKWSVQADGISNLGHYLPLISANHFLEMATHLQIMPSKTAFEDDWESIIHLLSGVHTLEIFNVGQESTLLSLNAVFVAISRCFDERDHPLIEPPLPRLSSIILSRDVPAGTMSLEDTIIESLRIRAFANVRPIDALYLDSFDEHEEDPSIVQALSALVRTVVWKSS